jgi:hypothetical protein
MLHPMSFTRSVASVAILSCSGFLVIREAGAADAEPWRRGRNDHGRVHDGFYFRAGSGFGGFDERVRSESSSVYGGKVIGRNRGIVTLGEFALGGTVAEGWVLGGGIYSADLLASTYRQSDGSSALPPPELDPGLRNLALIAPFVDYYPNPRQGFHFQAALGLATLTPRVFGDSATEQSTYLAVGGGLMFGAGHEWWVAEEWSIGVLARTTAAVVTGKDDADVRFTHIALTSPSLLVTLTYH